MKSQNKKSLCLNRETVRTLNPNELANVAGGAKIWTVPISEGSCSCGNSCLSCSLIYCPSAGGGHCETR